MVKDTRLVHEKIFGKEQALLKKADQLCISAEAEGKILLNDFKNLAYEYSKLLRQIMKLVRIGDSQQDYLYKLQADMQNILDNTGQVIFTTDENLFIDDNYSAECMKVFEQKIENKNFIDIIRQYNHPDTIEIIKLVLNADIFNENDFKKKVLMQLLPEEIFYKDKTLAVSYKIVKNDWNNQAKNLFMFVLTDISEKRQLELMMQEEKSLLETIVKIVSNNNLFKWLIKEYIHLDTEGIEIILSNSSPNKIILTDVLREIHTFKGDFSMFDMPEMVERLNEIEQSISEMIDNADKLTRDEIRTIIKGYNLSGILDNSLEKIRKVIGNQYFALEREEVIVEKVKLELIEEKLAVIGGDAAAQVLKEIKQLQRTEFINLLQGYPEYVNRLAERNGKLIKPLEIVSGDCILVDGKRYFNFAKVLVNVFRNAIKHGIEPPWKRLEMGKLEYGEIGFFINRDGNEVIIEISDDGQGIDLDRLKEAAIKQSIHQAEEVHAYDKDSLIRLIFIDGLSTADTLDELAGRGEGLAAVLKELELLGGRVAINTAKNNGTSFKFTLPLEI